MSMQTILLKQEQDRRTQRANNEPIANDDITNGPLPLMRPAPESLPFPVEALMKLGPAVTATHKIIQAPLAMCASSFLAAACLATQGHADIEIPTGEKKPLSCYFITIGLSGERKSATDSYATKAVIEKQDELRTRYEEARKSWKNEKDIWDKSRQGIINDKKDGYKDIEKRADLDSLGEEPKEPLKPLLLFAEPTYQGIYKYFEHGQPSVGLFSAEGGQFIGGHAMREENKMETNAGLNKLWDGAQLSRLRSVDGTSFQKGKRLAMHLMVQPETSLKLVSDSLADDQGLLARMLISYPESTQGQRVWFEVTPESKSILSQYNLKIKSLLDAKKETFEGTDNELNPRIVSLSREARKLWIEYDAHLERERGINGYFSRIRGLANKLPEHAARLAGVLTLYDNLYAEEVSQEYMAAGIELANYYAQEALRIKDMQAVDKDLLLAQRLLAWLKEKQIKQFPLSDIYRLSLSEIRTAQKARGVVKILEEHGYLRSLPNGLVNEGKNYKEAWEMI